MSKEWLEDWLKDKKEQLKSATVFINENGNEAVEVSLSVLNKLFEQAERVQELENHLKLYDFWYRTAYEQNKRYREALEFYADEDNYEWETNYRPQQEIDCMVIDDGGHTARKALQGEESA